jgi:hypothetical protein
MSAVLWSGRFRVYYNKHDEYPFIWSVDKGTVESERKFQQVTVDVSMRGRSRTTSDNRNEPKAWLEGEGELRQAGDTCVIGKKR